MTPAPAVRRNCARFAAVLCLLVWPHAPSLAAAVNIDFELQLLAGKPDAKARIIVRQDRGSLRELQLSTESFTGKPRGDGQLRRVGNKLIWNPPARGGELHYQPRLTHRRSTGDASSHDAWVGDKLAIFRADKAFPVAAWRLRKNTSLHGVLAVTAPKGWSVITPYLPDATGKLQIRNPGTRKARPMGWIIAGDIGTRRELIAGSEITVSAPRGIRMERIAMLALLRWTLPELFSALGKGPAYLNIVAAGEPMWLGALSAPNSIFVHADRPLISENGTSTIVHEFVHVLLADLRTPADQDWIDEGLAEYFGLRALRDSGTISETRYVQTIASLRRWGSTVRSLRTTSSTGPVTAAAVVVFHDLDAELRQATGNRANLASLVRAMVADGKTAELRSLRLKAQKLTGQPPRALAPAAVPGFD